jgi:hypothetical protein
VRVLLFAHADGIGLRHRRDVARDVLEVRVRLAFLTAVMVVRFCTQVGRRCDAGRQAHGG